MRRPKTIELVCPSCGTAWTVTADPDEDSVEGAQVPGYAQCEDPGCHIPGCENCNVICTDCGKSVCADHITQYGDEWLCVRCLALAEADAAGPVESLPLQPVNWRELAKQIVLPDRRAA